MGAVGLRARSDLRRHWRATVGLTLAVAVTGGIVMAAVAGAERTQTALPQFVEEYLAEDFLVYLDGPLAEQSELPARLEAIPGVAAASGSSFVVFASTDRDGRPVPGLDASIGAGSPTDDAGFHTITRPRMVEGRLASPTSEDEIIINQPFSDSWGVGVGDTLTVVAYAPDDLQDLLGDQRAEPTGPRFDLRVVGIVRDPGDVSIQSLPDLDSRHMALTPAFWAAHRDEVANFGVEVSARLEDGADPDAVEQAVTEAIDGVSVERENASLPTYDATQRAIELQANALLAATMVFAAAAAGLIGLSVFRRVAAAGTEDAVLSGLGWTRFDLSRSAVTRSLPMAVGGALGAIGVALALSSRFPIGTARQAEIDPGIQMNGAVLGIGGVLIALFVIVVAAIAGRRASALASVRRASRQRRDPIPGWLARAGAPTPVVVAATLPLDPRRRGTTITALLASVAAVGAVGAALILGANLDRLVDHPILWGQTWDVIVGLYGDAAGADAGVVALRQNADVEAFSATSSVPVSPDTLAIDGRVIGVVGVDPIEGDLLPTLLSGTQPDQPGEVALGRRTLDAIDRQVGDEVELSVPGGSSRRAVITGEVIIPASLAPDARLGDGATMTMAAVNELRPGNGYAAGHLVQFADGVSHGEGVASLQDDFGGTIEDSAAAPEIVSIDRVRALPWVLAGLIAALALATVIHALITGNRRQRAELAVLKALGFGRQEIRTVGAIQASTFSLAAVLLGLPIGIAVGTQAWRLVMDGLGLEVPIDLPMTALLLAIPATVLAGNLLAALPTRSAARTNPATALRAD